MTLTILSTSGTSGEPWEYAVWITRFVFNTRVPHEERRKNPLTTEELEEQRHFWERRTQREGEKRKQYQEDRLPLNLQPNEDGLLECRGRIQGNYPIYLPDTSTFTRKLVQQAHEETLHGESAWLWQKYAIVTAVEEADEEIGKILLWMQTIPGESATKPAARKPATRTNGWERTI